MQKMKLGWTVFGLILCPS